MARARAILTAAVALAAGCGRIGFGHDIPVDEAVGAVSVGAGHACTIVDGAVWCWGRNWEGQLGSITLTPHLVPIEVPTVAGAIRVASGDGHTCALIPGTHADPGMGLPDQPGAIWCWGYDGWLELGSDRSGAFNVVLDNEHPDPQPVPGLPPFPVELVAGATHNCARFEDGSVWCWGRNTRGEIGDGAPVDAGVLPSRIPELTDIVQLAAGGETSCALERTGQVLCWGAGDQGQLGDGLSTDASTPKPVPGLVAEAITVGAEHACALVDGGHYTCWGVNWDGRLGDGTNSDRNTPTAPSVGDGYVAIDAGDNLTCAVRADGSAACWGYNDDGAIGDGTRMSRSAPATVMGLSNARAVSAGENSACALRGDGAVLCWGYGSYGALGDGRGASPTPAPVPGLSSTQLTAGHDHTCAIAGGTIECWGQGDYGQLGDGAATPRSSPTPVSAVWGNATALQAAAGSWHTCALLSDASVWCWGEGDHGELGTGDTSTVPAPVPVIGFGPGTAKAITAGQDFTCAIKTDGSVWCWGENADGQLGDGTTTQQTSPVAVTNLTGVAVEELAAGDHHACARAGAAVYCWGDNAHGQLGNGTMTDATPTLIPNLAAKAIGAGGSHTCAIDVPGGLVCWGENDAGELGDGTGVDASSPILVGVTGAMTLGLATQSTCVATATVASCWGYNHYGELGTGDWYDATMPQPLILPGGTVAALAPGNDHGCLAISDGSVYCFGDNANGQLGLGGESRSLVAVPVPLP